MAPQQPGKVQTEVVSGFVLDLERGEFAVGLSKCCVGVSHLAASNWRTLAGISQLMDIEKSSGEWLLPAATHAESIPHVAFLRCLAILRHDPKICNPLRRTRHRPGPAPLLSLPR